ncbi:MAG: hypothetical protein PF636_05610, partial [Actinomycetota bacterium]|nr:hypothetical protein [Actinomycetota bacterium]
ITIALLPAFFAMWWLREIARPQDAKRQGWLRLFGRFVLLVGVTMIVYAPWLKMQLGYGAALSTALGFGIGAPDPGTHQGSSRSLDFSTGLRSTQGTSCCWGRR